MDGTIQVWKSLGDWFNHNQYSGLLRAYSGSIFSFSGNATPDDKYVDVRARYTKPYASRAVVVIGTGI